MPKVTFDSDVFMRRSPAKLPTGFYMSAVVLEELAASAQDGSVLNRTLGEACRRHGRHLQRQAL